MFDRLPARPLTSRLKRIFGRGRGSTALVIVIALAASAGLSGAWPSAANAADPDGGAQSPQYQEFLSGAGKLYHFTPGGPVTVPFRPRLGDTDTVDGGSPVALPAAAGSNGTSPNLVGPAVVAPTNTTTILRREVFGFLTDGFMARAGSVTLDYSTLSTIAYFGVGLNVDLTGTDPNNDGALYQSDSGWNGWRSSLMTSIINSAHAAGTRVVLTIESFAWDNSSGGIDMQTHLLSTPAARTRAAQQIAAEVYSRGADGVDLDFEPIVTSQRANYVTFVRQLRVELDKLHPGYELTFCANGAPGTYDLPNLLAAGAADAVFIMGYNIRGGSPAVTGSIDPLTSTTTTYSLTRVVNTFLAQVPAAKLILGLPWYGEAWSTGTSTVLNAPPGNTTTYGQPANPYYYTAASWAAMDPTNTTSCQTGWPNPCVLGKSYDTVEQTAWTAYYGNFGGTQNSWRELYFDDSQAFGARLDAIDGWNLRGVGIWALGYDNGNGDGDLTNTIAAKWETTETPSTFHPLSPPVRMLDTRSGNGLPKAKLGANTPATFAITAQTRAGSLIPAGASAVTGNVTVVNSTNSWAVYLGPDPLASPGTSTINFTAGQITGNGLTVALSPTGTLSATYMSDGGNTTDLVFDVTGYFTPDSSGATYHPLTPARLLDTRFANGLPKAPIKANTPATFYVTAANRPGSPIPAGATAVTGNVTVVDETSAWAIYLGPDPTPSPGTSTINFVKGDIKGNNLTVALGAGGSLSATYVSNPGNTTDLVFDVTGYYTADASGSRYVPLTPARLLDTRSANGLPKAPIRANTPATFWVTAANRPGSPVPAGATAVTGNVTVVNETFPWAVFLGPDPNPSPGTSTINFVRGDIKGNGLAVALGSGGGLSATYMSTTGNTTDLVFDVTGYFAP